MDGQELFGKKNIADLTSTQLANAIATVLEKAKAADDLLVQAVSELRQLIADSKISRRMQRGISTKGIVQYDGRVEVTGGTREEFEAEQAWMDQLQNRLQPTYEEFVEALPGPGTPEGAAASAIDSDHSD